MSERPSVVFIGPLPPPIAGMHVVNADMIAKLSDLANVFTINTSPGSVNRGLSYHITKTLRALRGVFLLLLQRIKGTKVLYSSVDDRWGGIWNICFIFVARLTGMSIALHHHSYYYIVKPTTIMKMIVALAGHRALHIVLCDEMKNEIQFIYPIAQRFFVAPNAVMVPIPVKSELPTHPKPLTLGLLSNLTEEKGVFDFITILESLSNSGINVRGILAGPVDPSIEQQFRQKLSGQNGRIEWLGPVSGDAKERFFVDIDFFVFPTKYRTESFGLVLLESLVRGVPILAPERGCICLFTELEFADIIPLADDFVKAAVTYFERLQWQELPVSHMAGMRTRCAMEGISLNTKHMTQQANLADIIVTMAP